jgi:uncharacterized SAM-binding protein YcdF (DUF218 family)
MYRVVSLLLQPHLVLFVLVALALANLWRQRKETRRRLLLVAIPFAGLLILSLPAVTYLALGSLEWEFPALENRPDDAEAIVVLSGAVRFADNDEQDFELAIDSLYRCVKAAALYHQGRPCPVILTGGVVDPSSGYPPCARLMKRFLLRMGVAANDLIVEDQATSTFENAVYASKILKERGLGKIILITDAAHMRRSVACFQRQGVASVVPCGCRYRATRTLTWYDFVPRPGAAQGVDDAWHEWLGTAWYWWHGRI